MKLLIIQEAGRHPENKAFREGLSYQRAFSHLGHHTDIWGLGYNTFKIPWEEMQSSYNYDVIFLLEQYDQTGWTPDFSRSKALKIHLSIDDHCNLHEHLRQVQRQKIDVHFSATSSYLPYYKEAGIEKSFWLPNAYDHTLVGPMRIEKDISIGFVGNILNRGDYLEFIKKNYSANIEVMLLGNDMVKFINRCQIHFNRNMANDINYRTHETLGCKTFLLTNYTPDLEKLYNIGSEIITYDSPSDLNEKIKYFLTDAAAREYVTQKGYKKAVECHTYFKRAEELLNILKSV